MNFEATIGDRTARVEVRGKDGRYVVTVDGRTLEIDWVETDPCFVSLVVSSQGAGESHDVGIERRPGGYWVGFPDRRLAVELTASARGADLAPKKGHGGPTPVRAPMPGRVVRVLVEAGEEVEAGRGLVVVEAMKMENELRSPRPGRVKEIHVREQQTVETGALLVVVE